MKNNIDEKLLREVEEKAKENLKGVIREEQLGYLGFLHAEMKAIFKEKGIDWKIENNGVSTD